ncbi:hypothetical protein [Actinoallomurus sp. NPDC050550]|uniref:hypothetical protein n=1 Tax=Actinoallomurus sp. NPDC050550 TaxID=3154937 RepID=UPI0033D68B2F
MPPPRGSTGRFKKVDGGDFSQMTFADGRVLFSDAKFTGGAVIFYDARSAGGQVYFDGADLTGGLITFNYAKFTGGTVDLRDSASWEIPPSLDEAVLAAPPAGLRLPPCTAASTG